MRSAETEPAVSATIQPAESADSQFEVAHRELRLTLIQAIARRVGKSLGAAGGGRLPQYALTQIVNPALMPRPSALPAAAFSY